VHLADLHAERDRGCSVHGPVGSLGTETTEREQPLVEARVPRMDGDADRVDSRDVSRIEQRHSHETDDDVEARLLGRGGKCRQLGDGAAGAALGGDLHTVDIRHGQPAGRIRDHGDGADHLAPASSHQHLGRGQPVIGGDAAAGDVWAAVTAGDVLTVGEAKGAVEIFAGDRQTDVEIIGGDRGGGPSTDDRWRHRLQRTSSCVGAGAAIWSRYADLTVRRRVATDAAAVLLRTDVQQLLGPASFRRPRQAQR
jgi:hypothetical protein